MENEEKQILLDELLDSIKKCQSRFGGKTELATESEQVIEHLCLKFEAILFHGLKSSVVKELFNQHQSKSPWQFIKNHLNRHDLERYMLLKNVKTDSGKTRAWLRSSLNEHSLERYFHLMLNDTEKMAQFYSSAAFLQDSERSSMLPQMAAGLNSILFAITIDNEALNHSEKKVENNGISEAFLAPKVSSGGSGKGATRKKKKSSTRQVITFDEDEIKARLTNSKPVIMQKDDTMEELKTPSPTLSMTYDEVQLDKTNNIESPTDALSLLSVDANSVQGDQVTKLTPMKNLEMGALIPLYPNDDCVSEDSISIKSFGEDQDYASAMSSIIPTPQPPSTPMTTSFRASSVTSAANSTLSREDLKQALLSVMERKEELQDQVHSLKKLLEKEAASTALLKQDLGEANKKAKDSSDKLQVRINSILRENELLKHQLKKYVGAVQKLRDGPQAHETLAHLEGQENNRSESKYVDYHFEASEYERKLIQVAEMHGELLEFNEHLQKLLQSKEGQIKRLKDELIDLRGPLPDYDEEIIDDNLSVVSEAESNMTSVSLNTARSLINIWIPSVFLSGTGNGNSHYHVYQVYLRIRDEEWNIYRRYSEFYALHKDLQKKDALVAKFDFPPKKTVGNKAEKFVEDRRKRLQSYLRQIVNLMIQTNPSLQAKPDREQVILLMPFFAENSHLRNSGSGNLQPHQRAPLFARNRRRNNSTSDQVTPLAI